MTRQAVENTTELLSEASEPVEEIAEEVEADAVIEELAEQEHDAAE